MQHPKIFVQDNFFEDNFLKKIQKEIVSMQFSSRYNDIATNDKKNLNISQRTYHQVDLSQDSLVVSEVKHKIKQHFNVGGIQEMLSYYFLSFPNTCPIPHNDKSVYNCLIYLLGDTLINNGTGFYEKNQNEYILHTHIGFKQNRAIFFSSSIWHSPLQFAGNSTPRYVMANFIDKTDKEEYAKQ